MFFLWQFKKKPENRSESEKWMPFLYVMCFEFETVLLNKEERKESNRNGL